MLYFRCSNDKTGTSKKKGKCGQRGQTEAAEQTSGYVHHHRRTRLPGSDYYFKKPSALFEYLTVDGGRFKGEVVQLVEESASARPEMGTRASRLQEEPAPSAFGKDGTKRDSYRRSRCTRPTSLMVDFSGSFEDTEANRSRSEEGSDSDLGQHGASADGSPADHHSIPSGISQPSPTDDNNSEGKPEEDGSVSPEGAVDAEHQPGVETGRTPHRTFSERLPGNRHSSSRNVGARSTRVRGSHQRPVSEAWIGLYRVNNRHGSKLTHSYIEVAFLFIYF